MWFGDDVVWTHLEDGEEVCQVISQHISSHRDAILPRTSARHRRVDRIHRLRDRDVKPGHVKLFQVTIHFLNQGGIVRARLVKPEDGGRGGGPCA